MNIKEMTSNEFHALTNFDKYQLIKEAFKDVFNGFGIEDAPDLWSKTGLDYDRCKEIYNLYTFV